MYLDTPSPRTVLLALLSPLLLSGGFAMAGDIYTWKDANGVVHYSDVKPETGNVKVLKAGTQRDAPDSAGSAATPKQQSAVDVEAAFRKRRAEAAEAEAKAERQRQEVEARKENCDAVSGQLRALRSGERMARYTPSGQREVIDDATRQAEINRLQGIFDSSCK